MKKFFGQLLGGIGKGAEIVGQISQNPLVAAAIGALPGGGTLTASIRAALNIAGTISHSILKAEATITTEGAGADKSAMVQADFEAGLDVLRAVENAKGNDVTYDQVLFKQIADAQVFVFNNTPKLIASIKIVPLAPVG